LKAPVPLAPILLMQRGISGRLRNRWAAVLPPGPLCLGRDRARRALLPALNYLAKAGPGT